MLIEYGSAIVLAVLCALVRKYSMIIVTAAAGSFLVFYNFGFMIGVLDNFFDIIEKIKSGKVLVG